MIRVLWLRDWPLQDRLRFGLLLLAMVASDVVDAIRGRHP